VAVAGDRRPACDWSEELGDEAAMLAALLPGVPVGIGPDRVAAAHAILDRYDPRRFLLDDGFSHHRLERDADVVVVPVHHDMGKYSPDAGPRREDWSALRRAQALVLLSDEDFADVDVVFERTLAVTTLELVTALVRREVVCLWSYPGGDRAEPRELQGRRIYAACALGRPDSLGWLARRHLGADVVGSRNFRDHRRFTAADLEQVEEEASARGASAVLSTLKDAVRLPRDWTPSLPWWIVEASLVWDRGRDALEKEITKP